MAKWHMNDICEIDNRFPHYKMSIVTGIEN